LLDGDPSSAGSKHGNAVRSLFLGFLKGVLVNAHYLSENIPAAVGTGNVAKRRMDPLALFVGRAE
jgi:hypothetical protein